MIDAPSTSHVGAVVSVRGRVNARELIETASTRIAADKGLLAMDESNPTWNKRFARLGIPKTEEARRADREMIVTPGWVQPGRAPWRVPRGHGRRVSMTAAPADTPKRIGAAADHVGDA